MKLGGRKCSSSPVQDIISGIDKVHNAAVDLTFIRSLENDLLARENKLSWRRVDKTRTREPGLLISDKFTALRSVFQTLMTRIAGDFNYTVTPLTVSGYCGGESFEFDRCVECAMKRVDGEHRPVRTHHSAQYRTMAGMNAKERLLPF